MSSGNKFHLKNISITKVQRLHSLFIVIQSMLLFNGVEIQLSQKLQTLVIIVEHKSPKSKTLKDQHPILGGDAVVYRTRQNGAALEIAGAKRLLLSSQSSS